YGFCQKNCVNLETGAIDPTCSSDNHECAHVRLPLGGTVTVGCEHSNLGQPSSQVCLAGFHGTADLHCFAAAGGTPISWQDWTVMFDPPRIVSSELSDATEVDSANSYYRTFGIVNRNVCIRRATGVSCASPD